MSNTEDLLRELLDRVESKELELLEIGLVDAVLTKQELHQIAQSVDSARAIEIVNELLNRGVLVELRGGFRSRMAESVRLFSHLRQSFKSKPVTEGKPLVWDYRILRQPRRRPERDTPIQRMFDSLPNLTPLQIQAAKAIVPGDSLRRFQLTGTQVILENLKLRSESAVMIAAGTGSGKTLAFYLPALLSTLEILRADQSNWVKTLAIYPRNELLKDQFASALKNAYDLSKISGASRPIRVGAWLGDTPHFASDLKKWKIQRGVGHVFPFSNCPECGKGSLIWKEDDAKNALERLVCSDSKCGVALPIGMVALTRRSLRDNPADIMFSTTESINQQFSDSAAHSAFGLSGNERVRMVLLDEVHTYDGLTGAQNAYLLRRIKHKVRTPIVWVGLSATLTNAEDFMGQLVNMPPARIEVIRPTDDELIPFGAEYALALRHDPTRHTGVLSLTLQSAMLLGRVLDFKGKTPFQKGKSSRGMFGRRTFIFTDKLDLTNRMFWQLNEIEGWASNGRPATPKNGSRTLAHLRSASQRLVKAANQEPVPIRDSEGQYWELPEILGHEINQDNGLGVSRVSSQEPGVDDDTELVVATASLEVGYSDDTVGAVLQHKAPADSSRFIQRKGRAGRLIEMRPWTVVTLSEWGRDKLAWQLYDQFLFPQIVDRYLPINNRYVQRIQAVYSTMDWLAERTNNIGGNKSVRTDLIGPAGIVEETDRQINQRRERQKRIASILEDILSRGSEYDSWCNHLKNALGLSVEDIDYLLVSPPRPLLLSLIPTVHRRLTTHWAGEIPNPLSNNVKYRNPLTEFAPASLFADLLSREVPVILPSSATVPVDSQIDNEQSLPVLRVIREFVPGNVSRHFGAKKEDRHWVDPTSTSINVVKAYKANFVCQFHDENGNVIDLFQPTELTLETPPLNVSETSSASISWNAHFEKVGDGASLLLPPQLDGSAISQVKTFLHGNGSALRIQRYGLECHGRVFRNSQPSTPTFNTFEFNGKSVALGFECEVDAIEIAISEVEYQLPTPWERHDRAVEYLVHTKDLPAQVTYFERIRLGVLVQALVVGSRFVPNLDLANISKLDDAQLRDELVKYIEVVVGDEDEIDLSDDGDGSPLSSNDAKDDLEALLAIKEVLDSIRKTIQFISGDGDDWTLWRQRRLASTVGTCFLAACQMLVTDVNTDSLQLDVGQDGRFVLISEMSPGGNGQLERIADVIGTSGVAFVHAFRRQVEMGDLEKQGEALQETVAILSKTGTARNEAVSLLTSWGHGQAVVYAAYEKLATEIGKQGIRISPALTTGLTSRFLGPSGQIEIVDLANEVQDLISGLSQTCGFSVDFRVAIWAIGKFEKSSLLAKYGTVLAGRNFERTVEMISWPTDRSAAIFDLSPRSGFGQLPMADRHLLSKYLGRGTPIVSFDPTNFQAVSDALAGHSEVIVTTTKSELKDLRRAIVNNLANPTEVGPLHLYPTISGLEVVNGEYQVRLTLEGGNSWHD